MDSMTVQKKGLKDDFKVFNLTSFINLNPFGQFIYLKSSTLLPTIIKFWFLFFYYNRRMPLPSIEMREQVLWGRLEIPVYIVKF